MILIIFLFYLTESLPIATECSDQLRRYYLDAGMSPNVTYEKVYNFTLGVGFVTIGINIQQAASNYQNATPSLSNKIPVNSYATLDIPYCYSNITFSCVDRIIYGITKTGSCTLLLDRDTTLTDIAGRLFVYPNRSPPCNGNALVTFYNTTIIPSNNGSLYSYDIGGIVSNNSLKSELLAISTYRSSSCPYSDGNINDTLTEVQWTCLDQQLVCLPRVNTNVIYPSILQAKYKCNGNPISSQIQSVYQVINTGIPIPIEEEFDIQFFSNSSNILISGSVYQRQLIKPMIIRQYTVSWLNINYTVQTAFGGYNFTSSVPSNIAIPDELLSSIPCVCNFSINCINNIMDQSENGTTFFPNNIFPIAIAATSTPKVRRGDIAFLMDGGSYDPDNYPFNLTLQWVPYPNQNVSFFISNSSSFINASFQTDSTYEGNYTIILFVSDGEDYNYTLINITAVSPFPTCNTTETQIFGQLNTTIYLNGSNSFDGITPNENLTTFWTQLTGYPVTINNSTSLVANFQTNYSGTYIFILNVYNGLKNCTYNLIVNVQPPTRSPVPDNGTSLPPRPFPDNRTLPPLYPNFSDSPQFTNPPFFNTPNPSSNITPIPTGSPPFFPTVPPPTRAQEIGAWVFAGILIGLGMILFAWAIIDMNEIDYYYIKVNKYVK